MVFPNLEQSVENLHHFKAGAGRVEYGNALGILPHGGATLSQSRSDLSNLRVWKEPFGCLFASQLLQVTFGEKCPAISIVTVSIIQHLLKISYNNVTQGFFERQGYS